MGLLSWLFPNDAEKVRRARKLADAGKLDDARALLLRIDTEEAEQLFDDITRRQQSRERDSDEQDIPAPGPEKETRADVFMAFTGMRADGSHDIVVGDQRITFNAPVEPDTDDGVRRDDPTEIALLVAEAFAARPLEHADELPFLEAVWLIEPACAMKDPKRVALVSLLRCAANDDADGALAIARSNTGAPWVDDVIDEVCAPRWPEATAELCIDTACGAGWTLARTLGRRDPELAERIINSRTAPDWREGLTLGALLGALDAGTDAPALAARWAAIASPRPADELRRLARVDLETALSTWESLDVEGHLEHESDAVAEFFEHLARRDPTRALALAVPDDSGYHTDVMPRLRGCHRGGADVLAHYDAYLDQLDAYAYRPYSLFASLLEHFLRIGDAERVDRTLERAGANAWQTALAAYNGVAAAARAGVPNLDEIVRLCVRKRAIGVVAGRDPSAGNLVAGHFTMRPPWMWFDTPRPVETLLVTAALGAVGPFADE